MSIEKHVLSVDEDGSRWTANELALGVGRYPSSRSLWRMYATRIELLAEDVLDMRIQIILDVRSMMQAQWTGDLKAAVPVKKWGIEDWELTSNCRRCWTIHLQ